MRRSIAIHQGHRILGNGKPHSFLSKVYLVNILLIALWLKTTESLQCQLVKRRPWSFTIVFTSRRLGGVIISCELFSLQGSCFNDISQGTGGEQLSIVNKQHVLLLEEYGVFFEWQTEE